MKTKYARIALAAVAAGIVSAAQAQQGDPPVIVAQNTGASQPPATTAGQVDTEKLETVVVLGLAGSH